jgi:hypothetical protein
MNTKRGIEVQLVRDAAVMSYLIELQQPTGPLAYVIAHAGSRDDARALIDAELGRDDANDDVVILGVHAIH